MSDKKSVYLDNNATTKPRPEVIEAMAPYYSESWGNPSSVHHGGRPVKVKLAEARETIAAAINADPSEIYFTSGGTESDNIAITGYATANKIHGGGHIITSAIEHPAVLETTKFLSKNGYDVTKLEVEENGMVHPAKVATAFRENTILVTIMSANNETGVTQEIEDIVGHATERQVAVHTDAVQSFLKVPIDVKMMGVEMLSVSSHKINGPKGVGALYIRKGTKVHPLLHGGHHERGIRPGTENVAGIIGFAKAVEIGAAEINKTASHVRKLRDELEKRIKETIPTIRINGSVNSRLPGTTNISFECIEGEALLINLDMQGIAISTGSACSSGSLDPSHVLMAMGIPHEIIHGSLRFSFGYENTMDDVDYVMKHLPKIVKTIRAMSPIWDPVNEKPITLADAAKGAKTSVKLL